MSMSAVVSKFAKKTSKWVGRPAVLFGAVGLIVVWLISGPMFGFSDTWQLVINTSTSVITFLMVFLIQHTQNVDTEAMQIKLDELIRATKGAHNAMLDLEELEEKELDLFKEKYHALAKAARGDLKDGEIGDEIIKG